MKEIIEEFPAIHKVMPCFTTPKHVTISLVTSPHVSHLQPSLSNPSLKKPNPYDKQRYLIREDNNVSNGSIADEEPIRPSI